MRSIYDQVTGKSDVVEGRSPQQARAAYAKRHHLTEQDAKRLQVG
jgi:hypothetical protein